ncbi:helix-turn-helix domain-containing protein [Rhizobium sp. YJ-22]|uniref:GlxA family transcriptional regulator n=1 Tax=Rhizobium sp. YJ-22 TaxID=3037556 RepID=UPI0024128D79|nr:helix-turn-helix domain-containing protein [Rhizobium sp. YJ-22]
MIIDKSEYYRANSEISVAFDVARATGWKGAFLERLQTAGRSSEFEVERKRSIALVVGREPSLHTIFLSIEPFRAANRVSEEAMFSIDFMPADPEAAPTSMDIALPVTAGFDDARKYDLVFLHVTYDVAEAAKARLFKWLRRQSAAGAHLCGVDAGPLLLAEAGLLDGYMATCHWTGMASLREFSATSRVVEQLYVVDRNRSTCAGQAATLDYSMTMLRSMCGAALYNLVCNELIYAAPRPAEVRQREIVNGQPFLVNPVLSRARRIMQETVEEPLEMEAIADRCGVSVRELQYLFRRHLNTSPKKIYMALRLQHAKELLLYSSMSIRETGLACGFATPSAYYRAFCAVYRKSPQEYRSDFAKKSTMYGRNLY